MRLLLFFFKKTYINYFSVKNLFFFISDLFLILITYYLSNKFINLFNLNKINTILNQNNLLILMYSIIGTIPILFKFIFGGFIKTFSFSLHYPIIRYKIAILDLFLSGFNNLKYLIISLSLWYIYYNTSISIITIINAHLFLIIGITLIESIIHSIFNFKYSHLIKTILLILFVILIISLLNISDTIFFICLSLSAILFFINYINNYNYSLNLNFNSKSSPFIFLNILYAKKAYLNSFVVALVFKIIAFFALYNELKNENNIEQSEIEKVFVILSFPLIIFTFIYNNTWGYFKKITINLMTVKSSLKMYLKVFLKLLSPALIFDFLLSTIILISLGYYNFSFVYLYFLFCIYALSIAFFGSFLRYFPIEKSLSFTSFRRNTSLMLNILTIVGITPFIFFEKDKTSTYFYLFIPIIIAFILFLVFSFLFENKIKSLKNKIFNYEK